MRADTLHRERLQLSAPLHLGQARVVVVSRTHLLASHAAPWQWIVASKQPWAIVIRDSLGLRAVDPGGTPLPIEPLCQALPALRAFVDEN